jgi:hypothetical protein
MFENSVVNNRVKMPTCLVTAWETLARFRQLLAVLQKVPDVRQPMRPWERHFRKLMGIDMAADSDVTYTAEEETVDETAKSGVNSTD